MHYGAGVISFCLCGQRLVYLAERTITLATSPHVSSHVQTQKRENMDPHDYHRNITRTILSVFLSDPKVSANIKADENHILTSLECPYGVSS